MNLHRLPWPLLELEALGETAVEMRVTLSYFIEPDPSARGVTSRYRYESHGLRFEVNRASESEADFRARINAAAPVMKKSRHEPGAMIKVGSLVNRIGIKARCILISGEAELPTWQAEV
jgi:hypothetical protein